VPDETQNLPAARRGKSGEDGRIEGHADYIVPTKMNRNGKRRFQPAPRVLAPPVYY
jgi:hypothetical protein